MNKKLLIVCSLFIFLLGCTSRPSEVQPMHPNTHLVNSSLDTDNITPIQKTNAVYTTERFVTLTFNGLPEAEMVHEVLALLALHQIKATFFVPGQRVAEEPNLVEDILSHGHTVENNTLNKRDLSHLSYTDVFNELYLSKKTIESLTSKQIKYVRAETASFDELILKAATESEHKRYIGYSLYLTDQYIEQSVNSAKDLRSFIKRGAIIAIDLTRNTKIDNMLDLISEAVSEVNYQFVTLDKLIEAELPKLPFDEIEGYDLAKINLNYDKQPYHMFDKGNETKKQVALTIDDWGTDYTVTSILDILEEENIIATFYIRANGAEMNPSLARAIADAGHEIANHTYSHPVITTITAEEIQEEVVKAHHVLTEAMQQPPSLLFRPPTGAIDDNSAKIVAATGYTDIAMYDVTTLDWDTNISADDIFRIISEDVTNGSIILLHMLDDLHTLEALPNVIAYLKQEGYTFVTTTEIMK